MAQTGIGAAKIAAKKIGISFDEYKRQLARLQKWCYLCSEWHHISKFGVDNSRYDGLASACTQGKNKRQRDLYEPKPKIDRRGRRYVSARNGDKKQARARVNYLVNIGLLENPNDLKCVDCGHIGNDRRHEYDHANGYSANNHEVVEAVCSMCHHVRHKKTIIKEGFCNGRE